MKSFLKISKIFGFFMVMFSNGSCSQKISLDKMYLWEVFDETDAEYTYRCIIDDENIFVIRSDYLGESASSIYWHQSLVDVEISFPEVTKGKKSSIPGGGGYSLVLYPEKNDNPIVIFYPSNSTFDEFCAEIKKKVCLDDNIITESQFKELDERVRPQKTDLSDE